MSTSHSKSRSCDQTKPSAIEEGLISTRSSHCEFCKRGSKPIRIAGDQFLPENPKHELLVIRKPDFSDGRESFFGQFAALRVLQWNRIGSIGDGAKEHFYIDVKEVVESKVDAFSKSLEKAAKRYISRDLKTVITLDDAGSISTSAGQNDEQGQRFIPTIMKFGYDSSWMPPGMNAARDAF